MKKQLPSDKTKDMVEFATKRPQERFNSIRDALGVGVIKYLARFRELNIS